MGEAAAIAGLISFSISSFQQCVQGFQLVRAAQNIGIDADYLSAVLQW